MDNTHAIGMDPSSGELARRLYEGVVPQVVPVSSCEVAEACKILENTYRAVNIALVNELKVVYPQEVEPSVYAGLEFDHFFIQPKDGPSAARSLQAAIQYCADHPKWRLSLQTHKLLGIR